MKKALLCITLALLALPCFAVVTVAGHGFDPTAGVPTYPIFVRFDLSGCGSNPPRVPGVATVVPSRYDFQLDANGNVVSQSGGTAQIYGNNEIQCPSGSFPSYWHVTWYSNNTPIDSGSDFTINTPGPFNLDSAVPNTTYPVVAPPTGDTTYLRLDGGNAPNSAPYNLATVNIKNQNGGTRSAAAYGAVCDGTTDDSTAIQNAINAGSGVVVIPNSRCKHTKEFVISGSGVKLQGSGGNSELYFSPTAPFVAGVNRDAILISGTLGTRRQIAAAIAIGATSFTLASSSDGADLVPGEWLIVEEYDTGALNQVVSDWVQVSSVVGTTVNVVFPFRTAYPHLRTWSNSGTPYSGTGFYPVITPAQNNAIQGLKITLPDHGQTSVAVSAGNGALNTTFEDLVIDDADGNAIGSFLSKGVTVDNVRQVNNRTQPTEFAATVDLHITNSYFGQEYSAIAPNSSNNADCLVLDIGTAFFQVANNTLTNCAGIGILLNVTPHNGSITNNHIGIISATGSAILCSGCQNVIMSGNTLTGSSGTVATGISFRNTTGFTVNVNSQNNSISNNIVSGFTALYDMVDATSSDAYFMPFAGDFGLKDGGRICSGVDFGDTTLNSDGCITFMDSSGNMTFSSTGSASQIFKINGGTTRATIDGNGLAVVGRLSTTGNVQATGAVSGASIQSGSDTPMTASPRMIYSGYIRAGNLATNTYYRVIPDKPITVTRVAINAATSGVTCSTPAVVRVTDGTTNIDTTIANATQVFDSGAISQNYAAGVNFDIRLSTAAVGCATNPADIAVTVQYKMQ